MTGINDAPDSKREKMLNLILEYSIPILETNEEVVRIAELYIQEKIIPHKYRTDGLHIAIALIDYTCSSSVLLGSFQS